MDKIEKCKKISLKKIMKENTRKNIKEQQGIIKKLNKTMKKTKKNNKELFNKTRKSRDFHKEMLKIFQKDNKKPTKTQIERYSRGYCNPGCEGTIFREKEYTNKELSKMYDDLKLEGDDKQKKAWMKNFKDAFDFESQSRPKNIKKLDNDSFYFEFDKKKKKELIKMGALSGCFFS